MLLCIIKQAIAVAGSSAQTEPRPILKHKDAAEEWKDLVGEEIELLNKELLLIFKIAAG